MEIFQLDNQLGDKQMFPKQPHVLLFCAEPASGKSTILINMLLQRKSYNRYYDQIYIFSKNFYSDEKQQLLTKRPILANNEPVSQIITSYDSKQIRNIVEDLTKAKKTLFIFDDLAINVSQDPYMQQIMIDRRHKNLSVWITGQRLKLFSKAIRTMADSWIICGGLSTQSERKEIYQDAVGSHGVTFDVFCEMLNYCNKEPFGFLYTCPSGIYNRFNEQFELD